MTLIEMVMTMAVSRKQRENSRMSKKLLLNKKAHVFE